MKPKPKNLRELLVSLPELAQFQFHDGVRYFLWKILSKCLENGPQGTQWQDEIAVFESSAWINGSYNYISLPEGWRDAFFKSYLSSDHLSAHEGSACSKQCYLTETVYHCFDCTKNPLYEICESCFDKQNHVGHRYTAKAVTRPEGRVCHCGDPSGFKSLDAAFKCKHSNRAGSTAPTTHKESMTETFSHVLDYLIDSLVYFKETSEDPSGGFAFGGDDLVTSGDTLIQLYESDCGMHAKDLVSKISTILHRPSEYGVMMASQLQQGAPFVILSSSPDAERLRLVQKEFKDENVIVWLKSERDVFREHMVDELVSWLFKICLYCSSLSTKASLRLAISDAWRSGLLSTKHTPGIWSRFMVKLPLLGGFVVPYEQRDTFPWCQPWNFPRENDLSHDPYVKAIMRDYDRRLSETCSPNLVSRFDGLHGSRFQYLLNGGTHGISIKSKFCMLKVFGTVFTIIDDSRSCLAAQYLDLYPTLLHSTVASDPSGYNVSLLSMMSQYTFQNPRIANLVIESGFIERVIRFAFTLLSFTPEELRECSPVPLYHDLKLPSETIKNKRTVICFKDINLVMSTNTIPQKLLTRESIVSVFLDTFSAFSNCLVLKRESTEHVEFESYDFSSFFFFFSSILVMIDGFTRNICLVEDCETRRRIASHFLKISMYREFELLRQKINAGRKSTFMEQPVSCKLPLRSIQLDGSSTLMIDFNVGVDHQNFFNPMLYFFKFMVQWSQCGRYESLPYNFHESFNFRDIFEDGTQVLLLCDSALRTLVLTSQISVGYWVRNGAPIQHQLRMYTKYSMREFTFFSDIYMVQFAMCMAEPQAFMATFFSRWKLNDWIEAGKSGEYDDDDVAAAMVDQCLLTLIQLLTDTRALSMKSSIEGFEKTMKMEIIHALCFKNASYGQIINTIPDHVTKNPAFDLYLKELASFIPPSGLMDTGVYSLKEVYLSSVDPFFIGFSASRRFEAEKLVRTHMASKQSIPYKCTYIEAKNVLSDLKSTPYKMLYQISGTRIFGLFLKATMNHINKRFSDSLLSKTVHLIHLCVLNNPLQFWEVLCANLQKLTNESHDHRSIGSMLYLFLSKSEFANEHGKIREIFCCLRRAIPSPKLEETLANQIEGFSTSLIFDSQPNGVTQDEEFEKKRSLARARREKLMNKIAKQQKRFMANNEIPFSRVFTDCGTSRESDGWKYPEASCVFCKMPHDQDTFVFFAYFERNICDEFWKYEDVLDVFKSHNVDFNDSANHQLMTQQQPVLRACGHGSHLGCLNDHMHSTRAVHSHITKNIPSSLGFSLTFCPLCSSLTNSFLPRLQDVNCRSKEDFFQNTEIGGRCSPKDAHIIIALKAVTILRKLLEDQACPPQHPIDVISTLLSSTVCNAELSSRLQGKRRSRQGCTKSNISNQSLLTLRLLSELKRFIVENLSEFNLGVVGPIKTYPYNIRDWEVYIESRQDGNLLEIANSLVGASKLDQDFDMKLGLRNLLKKYLHQDFLRLALLLEKNNSYEPSERAIFNEDYISNEALILESPSLLMVITLAYRNMISERRMGELIDLKSWAKFCYGYLVESLTVFMRRLYFLVHADYALNFERSKTADNELVSLLELFCQPSLDELLYEFSSCDLEIIKSLVCKQTSDGIESRFVKTAKSLQFRYTGYGGFARFPQQLSDLHSSEEDHINFRARKEELALCLFCGAEVIVQRGVPMQNFSLGECTDHLFNGCSVSSTYGCFLLVRSNTIYLSYGKRGTFYQAPYLNEHGETDEEYRNGTPVFLSKERYESLIRDVVLGNMVPHLVFRLTDNITDLGGWESM
ncbi:LAMI_0H08526g1_1 [Lachancea mirantina]|uniref:E3 ubiquitin-protein ligase n=1 Tax=Lachancea mirantina TaxID=1230905 RepID=A0A1G4KG66_9SACH|nr:LAMI_0H08526g1_1 [Lachancea mirantina]